jgi:outer membrane protein assembly factor BamB
VQVGTFSENADGSDLIPMMWATALDTGAVLWEIRREFLPRIAISNGLIHALQLTDVSGRHGYSLVSFNLSNGSQYGVSPLQTQDIGELDNLGPLGIGDWRFVSDSSGSTVAFGSAVEYENWMADPNFGRSDLPYTRKGGSQAANETSLYVATGQNHVRRLDLATGKVLFEANLNSEVEGEISNVTLYANLSMVVARIATVAADNAAMAPEMLVILNPVTGEIEETHPFAEIAGEIAIDGSRVYVPTRESPDDAIDIATTIVGSSGDPFMAFDVTTARSANLAITGPHGAGGPLVILDSNGTFWQETQVGTDPTQGLVVFSDLGSVWGVPGERDPLPIVGNGAELIVNDGAGRVTAFAPATDPTVEPSATPASGA